MKQDTLGPQALLHLGLSAWLSEPLWWMKTPSEASVRAAQGVRQALAPEAFLKKINSIREEAGLGDCWTAPHAWHGPEQRMVRAMGEVLRTEGWQDMDPRPLFAQNSHAGSISAPKFLAEVLLLQDEAFLLDD